MSPACSDVTVANCFFGASKGDGTHVTNAMHVLIAANQYDGTGDDSIGIVASDAGGAIQPTDVLVTGCQIKNYGNRGIAILETTDVHVTGCSIQSGPQSAIEVGRYTSTTARNYRIAIDNVEVYGSTTSAGALGAINLRFCRRVTVEHCKIFESVTGSGISFLDINEATINGNTVRGMPGFGISADPTPAANVATNWDSIDICNNNVSSTGATALELTPEATKRLTALNCNGNTFGYLVGGAAIYINHATALSMCNNVNPHGYSYTVDTDTSGVVNVNNN